MTTTTQGEHGELRDRMVAVETKLDLVLARLGDGHTDHESRIRVLEQRVDPTHADHESRLRRLERTVWVWTGAAAAGGGTLGAFLANLMGG